MKGKKINIDFVSSFMSECVKNGKISPEEIKKEAEKQLIEIEEKIETAEKLKSLRSNLLDVVESFSSAKKKNLPKEAEILDLFSLDFPDVCQEIVEAVKNEPITASQFEDENFIFSLKQLVEHRVLGKIDNLFVRGKRFDDFQKILRKVS